MSSLSDKLAEVAAPRKPLPIYEFLRGLSADDREFAWTALQDGNTYKTYRLLQIFNEEGGRFGKESFTKFRAAVLDGKITEADVHGDQ